MEVGGEKDVTCNGVGRPYQHHEGDLRHNLSHKQFGLLAHNTVWGIDGADRASNGWAGQQDGRTRASECHVVGALTNAAVEPDQRTIRERRRGHRAGRPARVQRDRVRRARVFDAVRDNVRDAEDSRADY